MRKDLEVGSKQLAVSKKRASYCLLPIAYCLLILSSHLAYSQKAVPELWGQRVHDDAHVLKAETVDQLEKELKIYEDSTSNQIAILIVQSLEGDVLEDYSIRVVEKWKLGKSSKDNGVLLLIAIDDHKMRIEVGHGLEGVLTDAQSNRIIRNELAPNFRRGDYDAGMLAGIKRITKAIGGEYGAETSGEEDNTWTVIYILFAVFCVVVLIATFVKEFRSKGNVSTSVKSKITGKRKNSASTKEAVIGAGFLSGMDGGSSSLTSGGSSGGSFLGGGGSFGGGGSSGSW